MYMHALKTPKGVTENTVVELLQGMLKEKNSLLTTFHKEQLISASTLCDIKKIF